MVRKDRKAVQPLHEKLEDRILFDAVPDGLDQLESLLNEANSLPSELQDESPVNPAVDLAEQSNPKTPSEIVFVEKSVEGYQQLVADLAATGTTEIHFLEQDADGLAQIASVLEGRTDLDAIHIISHGTDGQLALGNSVLDSESIRNEHADELAIIRSALS